MARSGRTRDPDVTQVSYVASIVRQRVGDLTCLLQGALALRASPLPGKSLEPARTPPSRHSRVESGDEAPRRRGPFQRGSWPRIFPGAQVADISVTPPGDRSVIKSAADLCGSAVSPDATASVVTPCVEIHRGSATPDVERAASVCGTGLIAALRFRWRSRRLLPAVPLSPGALLLTHPVALRPGGTVQGVRGNAGHRTSPGRTALRRRRERLPSFSA